MCLDDCSQYAAARVGARVHQDVGDGSHEESLW